MNYKTFIYKGNLSGISISDDKNWHIFKYPSSENHTVTNTNLYGPSIFPNTDKIRAVGNYTTVEGGNIAYGCLYQGRLDGEGKWLTILPYEAIQTICHSVTNNCVVGNYLVKSNKNSKAFVYNIKKNNYLEITKKGSTSITAYGIWENSKNSYTICGGYSERTSTGAHIGYVVDFDSKLNEFSNWGSYRYNNSKDLITHFEGISGTDKGYSLVSDAIFKGKQVASIAHIKRRNNGSFSSKAKWTVLSVPNKDICSANSIVGTTAIGVSTSDPSNLIDGFVSILI